MKAIPLDIIGNCDTPDETIETWYNMFLPVANKHAPLRSKKVRNKKAPWLTSELRKLITNRDKLKRQAVISNDMAIWDKFKKERNKINNEIKKANLIITNHK